MLLIISETSKLQASHVFTGDSGVLNPDRKHARTDGTQPLHRQNAHRKLALTDVTLERIRQNYPHE